MTALDVGRPPLKAALRSGDERAIRQRGPLAAIMAAPSEDAAVRRAALVLGQHWRPNIEVKDDLVVAHYPHPVAATDVTTALGVFLLLSERPGSGAA